MRVNRFGAAICLAAWVFAGPVLAATPAKVGVKVDFNGNDSAGKQLSFYLKDEIRRSGTFREADTSADAYFTLSFITIDPASSGDMTVYSYAILLSQDTGLDYYFTSYVGYCGASRVKECASTLFGRLGEQLEAIRVALAKSGTKS